jgi:hypothetical protein
MNEKVKKEYLFASDFDQTLSFNDSGFVLGEAESGAAGRGAFISSLA